MVTATGSPGGPEPSAGLSCANGQGPPQSETRIAQRPSARRLEFLDIEFLRTHYPDLIAIDSAEMRRRRPSPKVYRFPSYRIVKPLQCAWQQRACFTAICLYHRGV